MENMREMLKRSLGRSLGAMPELDRLAAGWTVACGRTLAVRGVVTGFAGGVVEVEVEDRRWLDQMESMRGMLERELGRIAGVKVGGIHFYPRSNRR